ncbi:MAG: TRAP transporter substrate-binding protein [Spirochaetaceae bacterium]|nr:MAG: TRAP transporter substrate-binding protein [Spirochaetaceae bacterium]
MMKRLMTVALVLVSATVFAAGSREATAPEPAAQVYEFTMAHAEAIGTPMTEAFEAWGQMLNERSGGRIVARHFPAGQLGNYTQLIEMSRLGTVQATAGGPDTEEAVAPEIAVTGLGYIFASEEHVDRVLQGEIGRRMSDIARDKTGVEFVDYGEVGFRHILSKRPVRNLNELRGLKIRTPELKVWVDFWNLMGANPTPLPYAEQYSALSTGVIDATEADFFSIAGFAWYEHAEHLTLAYHWFLPKAVRINAAWIDSLPADLQDLVRDTAREAFAEQRRINRANTSMALEELKSRGVQVYELEDRDEWLRRSQQLYDEYIRNHPQSRQMIEDILALM